MRRASNFFAAALAAFELQRLRILLVPTSPSPHHLPTFMFIIFNRLGRTALHNASFEGHLAVVQALVTAKSDVYAKDM